MEPQPYNFNPPPGQPTPRPDSFLEQLYAHLPLLIARISPDGLVLGMNPMVTAVTGYEVPDLIGRNFWTTLFPGRLFSQVTRFTKPGWDAGILRDYPMVLRTKEGQEKTVAWSRFGRAEGAWREIVCIGQDLTDRLLAADIAAAGVETPPPPDTQPDNAGDIEGAFVMPLAVSPPASSADPNCQAIQQVHEFLSTVLTQVETIQQAAFAGNQQALLTLSETLHRGAHACGLLHLAVAADRLHQAACAAPLDTLQVQVADLVAMCRQTRE